MGKKTYFSLPKRPLPNRTNLVITDIPGEQIDDCLMAYSIQDAIDKMDDVKENFVIGGASIYRQFLPFADKLYITWVHSSFEADTFFPEIDEKDWTIVEEEYHPDTDEKNPYPFTFKTYIRKKK